MLNGYSRPKSPSVAVGQFRLTSTVKGRSTTWKSKSTMLTVIERLYEPMSSSLPKTVVSISRMSKVPRTFVKIIGLPLTSVAGSSSV